MEDKIKEEIMKILNENSPLSSWALLIRLKERENSQNFGGLSSKKIGALCGELVREGLLIKEKLISNHEYGFYTPTSTWISDVGEWIQDRIPFKLPEIETKMQIEEKENILSGRTRITKDKTTVFLYISRNLLKKKNISRGIKCVIIHEFCHIVNPFHPDIVMKTYFPEIFRIWSKAERDKALECSAEVIKNE